MQVETPNSGRVAVSQEKIVFGRVCVPWTPEELATMRSLASGVVTREKIIELFPRRTVRSVRDKMTRVRQSLGVSGKRFATGICADYLTPKGRLPILDPSDPGTDDGEFFRRRMMATQANAMMLERLRACG